MVKLFSQLIGADIVLSREQAKLGEVKELLINPDDGALLGIFCFDPIEKRERILPASELMAISRGVVVGKDYDSLSDAEEIVRIKKIMPKRSKIIGCRVYTKSGQLLGRVSDATLNTNLLVLEKIYVNQLFSPRFSPKELIIAAKKIEEIQPKKIIVSDEYTKIKVPSLVATQLSVPE